MIRALLGVLTLVSAFLVGTLSTPAQAVGQARPAGRPYTLLQMNLCLSGLAGCYPRTEYPSVVEEAVQRIRKNDPDAVTLNEACSRDAERIAERTGYHMRFATVIYQGAPLECVDPGSRGVFGNAVLTEGRIIADEDRAFATQFGVEERRWICATTVRRVDVCTAHLSTRGSEGARLANDAQCVELANVLERRASRAVTFAGDVNRQDTCAPEGMWTLTDVDADQAPGIQHGYGTASTFRQPTAEVQGATYTDHDFLVIRSRLAPARLRVLP